MTTRDPSIRAPIHTERLDLVLLTGTWLRAHVQGEPRPELGFTDPDAFLSDAEHVVNRRVEHVPRLGRRLADPTIDA